MRFLSVAKSLWLIRAEASVMALRATRIFCVGKCSVQLAADGADRTLPARRG
jgi:hypothetical protein